jgi:hypothetical protein
VRCALPAQRVEFCIIHHDKVCRTSSIA